MRILQVIQKLDTAGAEVIASALVRGAKSSGHQAAVAAAPGSLSRQFRCQQYRLPLLQRRPERIPGAVWLLRHALREWRPDIVHCHNPGMAVTAALARIGRFRPPALVSVHGLADQDYSNASRALRLAGLPVVACGSEVACELVKHSVTVEETIANGIAAAPPPLDRRMLMRQVGLSGEWQLIVSVGRLAVQKNQALAIQALSQVPGAALIILGEGDLREELVHLSRTSGVEDRVIFAGVRSDARAVMAAADAVVISSHWEGLPLVALETLAARTPLVATAATGLRGLVQDGTDCLLVPPGDERALASALRRILSDRALVARLTQAGLKVASAHSEERMLQQYSEFYAKLMGTR